MSIHTTYSKARTNLAHFWNEAALNREIVVISRQGSEDVALISASELESLLETAHLLRSPNNAKRLMSALNRANANTVQPQTIAELRQEVGLGEETSAAATR